MIPGSLSYIGLINEILTPTQLEIFRKCCFGHLLDIKPFEFACQVGHCCLLREVESDDSECMWFKFGDEVSRFSIDEFASITGLKCDKARMDVNLDPSKIRIKEVYFIGNDSVTKKDLVDLFASKPKFLSDEDAVKIAQLLVVECVIQSKRLSKNLDSFLLRVVDDQEKFNSMSWGRRSFDDTIGYMRKALKNKTPNETNTVSYELCGFPWAFQVWAYETIPKLGEKYATRIGNRIPKILNWCSSKKATFELLHTYVFGMKMVSNVL